MKASFRAHLAVLALAVSAATGASAQSYDDGYEPPRRRVYRYEEERYARPARPVAGLNCDAIQPGMFGPKPFSCPLPGPRPLGARCFCQTPVAPLSGGDTVAGRVAP